MTVRLSPAPSSAARWPTTAALLALTIAALLLTAARLPALPPLPALDVSLPPLMGAHDRSPGFVPNRGQSDAAVLFELALPDARVAFGRGEVAMLLPAGAGDRVAPEGWRAARLQFHGASAATVRPAEPAPATVSIFRGDDPAAWQRGLPTYEALVYEQLYPGIELRYDRRDGRLKSTYTLAAGADPARIAWSYQGVSAVALDAAGALVLTLPQQGGLPPRQIVERAPVAWQVIGGRQLPVAVAYDLRPDGIVGFAVGDYVPGHPLVIDPEFVFSTYAGGSGTDSVSAVAVDAQDNIYVVGDTGSPNLPTRNPFQGNLAGSSDVLVAKYRPSGELVYATYLGGANLDRGYDIAVDELGNAYLTGSAGITSINQPAFPTTPGAFDRNDNAVDAFVAKLSPDGSQLLYSTLYGDGAITVGMGIAIDAAGQASITGEVRNESLPTRSPFQPRFGGGINDAFVAKFNATGSDLVFASYIGGNEHDTNLSGRKMGIHVDRQGAVYIAGETRSAQGFPITPGAFDTQFNGLSDAYVVKIKPDGSGLEYGTFLGGDSSVEEASSVVVLGGEAYVTGTTTADNFPTTAGSYQPVKGRAGANFVARLNAAGNGLIYATYYGGDGEFSFDIALDSGGRAYIVGLAQFSGLSTPGGLQSFGGQGDGFVAAFSADGSSLLFGSFLGGDRPDTAYGVAVAGDGTVVVGGETRSFNFPTSNAAQGAIGNPGDTLARDGFVSSIRTGFGQPGLRPVNGSRGAPKSLFALLTEGLTPRSTVNVTVNGLPVGRLQVGDNGSLLWALRFGALAPPGTYTIRLTGSSPTDLAPTLASAIVVETEVTIDPAAEQLAAPAGAPSLSSVPEVYIPLLQR